MHEARIIMPFDGRGGVDSHKGLKSSILSFFGGYTATFGNGGWTDNDDVVVSENVGVYDIAMEDTESNRAKLRSIALYVGRSLDQQAVYIRYPNGQVVIMDVTGHSDPVPSAHAQDPGSKPAGGGSIRLPNPGEVWRNRGGDLIHVIALETAPATGGRYLKVRNLRHGGTGTDTLGPDGRGGPGGRHPLDLIEFIAAVHVDIDR